MSILLLFKLNSRCQVYEAYEEEYQNAYEFAKFRDASTDADYYFGLPLFTQGERDASILISANNTGDIYQIDESQLFVIHVFCLLKLSVN